MLARMWPFALGIAFGIPAGLATVWLAFHLVILPVAAILDQVFPR
jgi:hypothetical protein